VKFLVGAVFLTISLLGVQIDTNLYEGENTLAYYDQLDKKLAYDTAKDDEEKERLRSEKTLLEKLRVLIVKEPPIQTFSTTLVEKEKIEDKEYVALFDNVASAVKEKNKLEANQMFIQEKLSYLKKRIEGISDLQHENLRLYQLQFAYYKLKQRYDGISIQNYEQFILEGDKVLSMLIPRVKFDLKAYEVSIAKSQKEIERLNKKLIAANLSKERELLSQEAISPKLAETFKKTEGERDEALEELADKRLLAGLYYFQQKNIKAVLLQEKEFRSILKQFSGENALYDAKLVELEKLTKSSDDSINYNVLTMKENLLTMYEKFSSYIRTPFLVLDEAPISFLSIIKMLAILFLGFLIAKIYFTLFTKLHKKRKDMKTVSIKVVANMGSTFISFYCICCRNEQYRPECCQFGRNRRCTLYPGLGLP